MWLLVTIITFCIGRSVGLVCTKVDACSCTLDDGSGVINVTSLGKTDLTPMFADQAGPDGYLYSVNLCQPFNEADCSNAAGCRLSQDKTTSYPIGDANSITYGMNSNNQVQLLYSSDGGGGTTRATIITLVCDQSKDQPSILVNRETTPGVYGFMVTTKCGCPNGCSSGPPPAETTPTLGPPSAETTPTLGPPSAETTPTLGPPSAETTPTLGQPSAETTPTLGPDQSPSTSPNPSPSGSRMAVGVEIAIFICTVGLPTDGPVNGTSPISKQTKVNVSMGQN